MLQGVFVGYRRSGDYLVVDADAYRNSYQHNSTYVHRAKEIFFDPNKLKFPIKDGSIQSLPEHKAEAQVDETTTTQWEHVGQQPAPSAGPEIQNAPSSAGVPNEPHPADEWIDRPHVLIRKHNTPRLSLFQPGETQDCPIP